MRQKDIGVVRGGLLFYAIDNKIMLTLINDGRVFKNVQMLNFVSSRGHHFDFGKKS